MAMEIMNFSGLIQPLTPVMTLGSISMPSSAKGISRIESAIVSVKSRLNVQAR